MKKKTEYLWWAIALIVWVLCIFGLYTFVYAQNSDNRYPDHSHEHTEKVTAKKKHKHQNAKKKKKGKVRRITPIELSHDQEKPAIRTVTGRASWYGAHGNIAAYMREPIGTQLRVTNLANGKSVIVKVADRGAFEQRGVLIDLSDDAFTTIASLSTGIIDVKVETL